MDIVFASNNQGKVREVRAILEGSDIRIHSLADLDLHIDVVEDGNSFIENALIKASTIAGLIKRPVLADDSGLEVDALNGAPGIYSARYGGPDATDKDRNRKLLSELEGLPAEKRGAHYVCAVCCVFPDESEPLTAEGYMYGTIGTEERGERGFGYDPLFIVKDGKTVAEITDEEKDAISHRGNALRLFRTALLKKLGEQQ